MKTNIKDCLDEVLHYVLESEAQHFIENPCKEHIYYSAYCVYYGINQANQMLEEALKNEYV